MKLKNIIAGIAAWAVIVLAGCFIAWSVDFGSWSADGRFCLAMASIGIGVLVAVGFGSMA